MKKLFYLFFMLILISLISFITIYLSPNSFIANELNPNITKESIEHLKELYGLDKPIIEQYFIWLKSLLSLDFGVSFVSGNSVSEEILKRLPITITINLISLFLVFILSLYLGIKAAFNQNRFFDKFVNQLSVVSFAMPSFYLAVILILIFSVNLKLTPISGLHSKDLVGLEYYLDLSWHLILPIFVIVFSSLSLSIYIRGLVVDILKSDYIFFAKARKLSDTKILFFYILPNLAPPIITMLGLSLPSIIGGSVILESIFGIDGMGLLFYRSVLSYDYPVIMGIVIIGAFLTLLGNIIADLILIKINPNIKN